MGAKIRKITKKRFYYEKLLEKMEHNFFLEKAIEKAVENIENATKLFGLDLIYGCIVDYAVCKIANFVCVGIALRKIDITCIAISLFRKVDFLIIS